MVGWMEDLLPSLDHPDLRTGLTRMRNYAEVIAKLDDLTRLKREYDKLYNPDMGAYYNRYAVQRLHLIDFLEEMDRLVIDEWLGV